MLLSQEEIKAIIPHREPFLFVDEILELDADHAVGRKYVRGDEDFFRGHFPAEPVMPGVLILEAIAQVGAVCVLAKDSFKGRIAYFGKMDNVRFRHKVVPGDVLRLEMTLNRIRGSVGFGQGKAFIGENTLAVSADMVFAIGDPT